MQVCLKWQKSNLIYWRIFYSQNVVPLCMIAGTNCIFDPPPLAPSYTQPQPGRPKKKVRMINLVPLPLSTTLPPPPPNGGPPCIAHSMLGLGIARMQCVRRGTALHGCQMYPVTSRLSTSLPVFWHLKTHPTPNLFFIPFQIQPHILFLF